MDKRVVYGILAAVILFNLIFTASILKQGFPSGGDNVGHYDLVVNTIEVIKHFVSTGDLALWNEDYYFGFPLFFYYAPLPYVLLAIASIVTSIDPLLLFKISLVLLYSCLPLVFYTMGRLMEFDDLFCLGIAIFSTSLSSTTVFGLEYYAFYATGLFSQLCALVFFPFAFAYAYRYFVLQKSEGNDLFFIVLFLFLSFVTHFLVGFIAAIAVALLIVSAMVVQWKDHAELWKFVKSGVLIFLFFFISVSFLVVPYLLNQEDFGNITFDQEHKKNGYGLVQTLDHFFTGKFLDYSADYWRLQVLTLLFFIGIFCVARGKISMGSELRIFLFLALVFSLLCLAGEKTFAFLSWLPLLSSVQTFRFIFLFHFVALFFIGSALFFVMGKIQNLRMEKGFAIVVFVLLLLSLPVFYERAQTMQDYSYAFDLEQDAWYTEIIANIEHSGRDGRVYVPFSQLIEMPQHLQAIPLLTDNGIFVSTGIGGHDSIMAYYAGLPIPYELMDVFAADYIITEENGKYKLFVTEPDTSMFGLVTVPFVVDATAVEARDLITTWILSDAPLENVFIIIEPGFLDLDQETYEDVMVLSDIENDPLFMGFEEQNKDFENRIAGFIRYEDNSPTVLVEGIEKEAYAVFSSYEQQVEMCGSFAVGDRSRGTYVVTVDVSSSDCYVLFKMSYHPEWQVTIDGVVQDVVHLSPGFMGVAVNEGEHTVEFTYNVFWYRPVLLVLSIVGLLFFWFVINNKNNKKVNKEK
jgi:hypothetical protein